MPNESELTHVPTESEPTVEQLLMEQTIKDIENRLQEKSNSSECCENECGCEQVVSNMPAKQESREDELIIDSPICWDEVKTNSVLVIKIDASNPTRFGQFQQSIVKHLLEPRMEMLKEKKLSIVFMGTNDDISVLDEKEMNKLGWFKKEKNLIITPDQLR